MHLTDERLSVTASACDLGRIPAHANVIDAVREKKTRVTPPGHKRIIAFNRGTDRNAGTSMATRGLNGPQAFRQPPTGMKRPPPTA